jgi:hypothetical protein
MRKGIFERYEAARAAWARTGGPGNYLRLCFLRWVYGRTPVKRLEAEAKRRSGG